MSATEQIVLVDDFDAALRRLKDKMPDEFEFEISAHHFRDLDLGTAISRSRMLKGFEGFCWSEGYSIRHDYVRDRGTYLYSLKRKKALPAPKKREENVIDI